APAQGAWASRYQVQRASGGAPLLGHRRPRYSVEVIFDKVISPAISSSVRAEKRGSALNSASSRAPRNSFFVSSESCISLPNTNFSASLIGQAPVTSARQASSKQTWRRTSLATRRALSLPL